MMIRKLTASFGKLENETLTLHDGLNVIYAPNESGKSTWCAFIRSMLYGIDSSERSRAGHLPDKLRYAPWSGAPMEGSMDLTADHCDITITRSTRAKNAPMREFTATYTGTNVPVEGMNGQNAGELLTGVSKDVFRRSAFIGQGTVAVTGSPELEKRISSLVASGEEETSYTEADQRLRAWQRKRRYNRKGMLPELEGEMDQVQQRLSDMGTSVEDVHKLEAELEQQQLSCEQLEQQVIESRRQQRRQALEQLNLGRENVRQRSALHDTALEELDLRRQALRGSDFGDRSPEELEAEFRDQSEEIEKANRQEAEESESLREKEVYEDGIILSGSEDEPAEEIDEEDLSVYDTDYLSADDIEEGRTLEDKKAEKAEPAPQEDRETDEEEAADDAPDTKEEQEEDPDHR